MQHTRMPFGGRLLRLAAALSLLTLSGCGMVVLDPAGDVALQQRDLILIATGLMLVIIIPVMIMIVVFAWRYRKGAGGTYDPHFDHSTGLELLIWAGPLLIIICLGAVTWSSTHLLDPFRPLSRLSPGRPVPEGTKPLEIQAVALDWKWLFIYPGQGIAAVNELVLPVDTPVHFSITSTDQMNTFSVPTLAGMIYAMPGMRSELHAVLIRPVESWGQSANYTGRGFSDMRFAVHGVDAAGFEKWVAKVKADGSGLTPAGYIALEKPSEKNKVAHYNTVSAGLFDRIVNRCVEPGKPCASDVMRHDMERSGPMNQTPAHEGMPMNGSRPVPALAKPPEDMGSGPNVTKPPQPDAPGPLKPGDQRNRDHSALPEPGIRGLS